MDLVGHAATAAALPAALPADGRGAAARAAAGGVRGDLEPVFRAAYPRVVGVAARVLGSRDEAEDLAQEVFLAFARSAVPAGEATGWLAVAAAHTALNHLRSGRRRAAREERARDGAAAAPDIADAIVARDERRLVRAALVRLPRKQAVALVLRHSGLSYAEVAAALDLSPGSVGTTVRRAESALRKELRHAPPTDGTLRRLVDEPARVADADREHVADCSRCLADLAVAQQDAESAVAVLAADTAPDVDLDAAWERLTVALAAGERAPAPARARRWRPRLRSPAAAAFGAAAVLAGAGVAAAADWLPIFRTERVAPVAFTEADLIGLPDLSELGELDVLEEPEVREVPDAASAERATGLPVPRVRDLPRNVTGAPSYQVAGRMHAVFEFSADEAAQAAAEAGEPLPPPPPGMDESRFRLTAGPGLTAVWTESRGVPALVVARAVAPRGASTGVPFATARDYVLSLPGVPEDVATQLRGFSADGTTLPLPVPARLVATSAAEVAGRPATVLESRDGALAAVVWADDGIVTAVGGLLSAEEVLAVARELRQR